MAPRAPAKPTNQANKEKPKRQSSGIYKAKTERKATKATKRKAQTHSTISTSPNTGPADAKLVSGGRSLWIVFSEEDLDRKFLEAMENVKLPDGEFDHDWYHEAFCKALDNGKTTITVQDLEKARTQCNIGAICALRFQATLAMETAKQNLKAARNA